MNSSYEYMKRDLEFHYKIKKRLEKELKKNAGELEKIPKGYYMTSHVTNGRRYYYDAHIVNGKEKLRYIGGADNAEVKSRQELHYLKTAIKNVNNNIKYLQRAIDNYKPIDPEGIVSVSGKTYRDNYDVGGSIFKQTKADEWVKEGLYKRSYYEAGRPYPEGLVLRTVSGEMVRTRGEVIIANTLDSFGLSYVYEWPKWIDGRLRWPDFTVLHPKTKEIITIEYMGRYDDSGYREKNNPRMEEFFNEGYILGQNLLVFMDNADGIIDSNKIHRVIKAFFMD